MMDNSLRKAAEMALEALRYTCDHLPAKTGVEREVDEAITALQIALAQPEQEPYASQAAMVAHIADRIRIDPETGNVSIGTPAQALDLQTVIERGTKAWADVPDATEWVDELRGNHKPPVKTYCGGKPNYCTPEEAFTLDRGCYERGCVAFDERDGDGVIMLGKRVHKTDKSIHEPVCFLRETSWSYEIASWDDPNGFPVYTAPLKKEWVGLTDEDIDFYALDIGVTANKAPPWLVKYARDIEAKSREKNS